MHHFSCHILRPLIGRFLIGCTWALAEALVLGALGGAALSIWLYFEREVLALFRMRLNVQRRLILGGYSWKEYFREMWSIWHGAQACRKRFDIFRVELEIAIVEEWEVRHGDILRHYGMSEVTGPIVIPLQFHYPYRRV
ncbi:hypothetical protein ARMSODRAFT_979925 [Armillaria solidipes]|uniref:Uncharacterized protein n=1 Tax=Armillaria solidipes TaxID=1076256 RepID=A0A2H3B939_9AGAR|nr:hypothetical protein ARMSODRAFT_979925 [Armillaria solidipes]